MNKIHTAILALVLSIFLIQAADPNFDSPIGTLIKFHSDGATSKSDVEPHSVGTLKDISKNILTEDKHSQKITDRQYISTDLQPPPLTGPQFLDDATSALEDQEFSHSFLSPRPILKTQVQHHNHDGINPSLSQNDDSYLPIYPPIDQPSDTKITQPQDIPDYSSLSHVGEIQILDNHGSTKNTYITDDIGNPDGHSDDGKSAYEELLEKDLVKPLLKLYEKEIHAEPNYVIQNYSHPARISKEDYVDNFRILSNEELDMLMHDNENMFLATTMRDDLHNNEHKGGNPNNTESAITESHELKDVRGMNNVMKDILRKNTQYKKEVHKLKFFKIADEMPISKPVRRDDITLVENSDEEHIGEILPTDFRRVNKHSLNTFLQLRPSDYLHGARKQKMLRIDNEPFFSERSEIVRYPVIFPGQGYHPEFQPSAPSSDAFDPTLYQYQPESFNRLKAYEDNIASDQLYSRSPRLSLSPDVFRASGRFRGVREQSSEKFQPYFDPSARYQTAWSSRRPRVIFPSDQVAFKDPVQNQEQEPEWLAGDNVLQDLQEQDVRDRGYQEVCAPGATCEFFLSCWLSGGLLDQSCGGLLRGCCFRGRVAKAGQSGLQAIGTLEAPPETGKSQTGLLDSYRCGVSAPRGAQRRIVGGEEAGFGTFPWQAYIRIGSSRKANQPSVIACTSSDGKSYGIIDNNNYHLIISLSTINDRRTKCGGSLVSRKHVVTAGHCVARATPRQVHVTLGDYVINSAVEPLPAYTFGVSNIQVHPFFKFTPQADRFDVAVLRLDRAAHNLPHIAPICLPPKGDNFLGEVGVAAGWGALSPGSRLRPQTLQAVQVPVIENRQCERWHRSKGISVTIYDEMMCAGYKTGGRDSCQGDSGGPLMLQKTGRWFLIGIVSAGYSCAQPGQPGIYHRVAHTVDWITRAIGS